MSTRQDETPVGRPLLFHARSLINFLFTERQTDRQTDTRTHIQTQTQTHVHTYTQKVVTRRIPSGRLLQNGCPCFLLPAFSGANAKDMEDKGLLKQLRFVMWVPLVSLIFAFGFPFFSPFPFPSLLFIIIGVPSLIFAQTAKARRLRSRSDLLSLSLR